MKGLATFARKRLGLELWPGQVDVLEAWADSGKRKGLFALGRRSGKGLMGAVAAIHNAAVVDYSDLLRPNEQRFIVCVATRQEQAREFIRVVRELLSAAPDPNLAALVDTDASTQDEIAFRNGVTIRAMPCSSRSTRGLATSLLIMDEAAHMVTSDGGFAAGKEVYRALLPGTAQFGDRGYVMLTSSPLWCQGIFWELFHAAETGAAADVFLAQRPTWAMNPTISRASLEFEFRSDPDSARSEYGAEFVEGAGAFLTATSINECVVTGRQELPHVAGVQYVGVCDPAFARAGDAFTFAIGHRQGMGEGATFVLDVMRSWRGKNSPLSSDTVLDEIAELARAYNLEEITSDQYAIQPLADGMKRRNLVLRGQALTNELKSDIFTALKRGLNNGQVELLDHAQLIQELIYLETRPTPSGKPRIGAFGSRHDDHAMAVATLVHQLAAGSQANKTYGSARADADEWVAYYGRLADESQPEHPEITVRVTHHN